MIVDAVVPARDEASTVADVVAACRACAYVRDVIVVDDGSSDGTGDLAVAGGAKVVRRERGGSKAHAMAAGVAASDADSRPSHGRSWTATRSRSASTRWWWTPGRR